MKSTKLQKLGQRKRSAPAIAQLQQLASQSEGDGAGLPELPELPDHETSLRLGLAIAQADGTPALQIAALKEINRFHESRAKAGDDSLDSGLTIEERLNSLDTILGAAQE